MTVPPPNPRIYHITHVANLPGIVADGGLVSDAAMRARGGPAASIGMESIKSRRLGLPVTCHPGAANKEGKQAESQIGVFDQRVAAQTSTSIAGAAHQPTVSVQRSWYF